jgi:hypothetical protein
MVRYFFAWMPLLSVGTLCILALPWLGLIALMIIALVALPAFALAIVVVPYMLSRALGRLWHRRGGAIRLTAPALHVLGPGSPRHPARDVLPARGESASARSPSLRGFAGGRAVN